MPSAAAISASGTSTASQASDTTRDPRSPQTNPQLVHRCGPLRGYGLSRSSAGDDLREVGQ